MPNTRVQDCNCVSVEQFSVKSAGTKQDLRPTTPIPWMNRENGAKYQDAKYGKGMRLHNIRVKGKELGATCTVCGNRKAF